MFLRAVPVDRFVSCCTAVLFSLPLVAEGRPDSIDTINVLPGNPDSNTAFQIRIDGQFQWGGTAIDATSVWTAGRMIYVDLQFDQLGSNPFGSTWQSTVDVEGQPGGTYDVEARLIDGTQSPAVVAADATTSFFIGPNPPPGAPDRFETNGPENPTALGSVTQLFERALSIHDPSDEDYFNVAIPMGNRIGILFDHEAGDLDLQLLWPQLPTGWFMVQSQSASTTDNEIITLTDGGAGVTVRVHGKTGTETQPSYDLIVAEPFVTPQADGDLAFGDLDVGSTAVRMLTIHNGDDFEHLDVISVYTPYGFSGAWSGAIPPGGTWEVPITFAPSERFDYSGQIRVRFPNADTLYVDVSGRGVQSVLRLPSGVLFGDVEVGTRSSRMLTVCNDGNKDLTVSAVHTDPGFSCDESGVVPGGQSNEFTIAFDPTAEKIYTGTVAVVSDADIGSSVTHISGLGTITLTLDADGDGVCDAHEFIAGTIPTNAESFFGIGGIQWLAPDAYRVDWTSVSGRTYQLFVSTNLASGFDLIAPSIPCTPPTNRLTRPASTEPRFIRLGVRLDE